MVNKKKLTLHDLGDTSKWKSAVVVFTKSSFDKEYSEESRSYKINSRAKYFNNKMHGNSLVGSCLDGSETIRLDHYLADGWVIDYCYITETTAETEQK